LDVIWRLFESFQEIFQQFKQECYALLDCIGTCTVGLGASSTNQWFRHITNKQIQIAADAGNALLSSAYIPGPFTKSIHSRVEILLRKLSKLSFKYICLILQLYEHLIYKSFCFTIPQKDKTKGLMLREYAGNKPLLVILSSNTSLYATISALAV
jgi:hypothetical protein